MAFDTNGRLTQFDHGVRTSYERGDRLTLKIEHEAPEPGTLLLLGGGIVAVGIARRRQL
jgi:hypothetical protein